MNQLFFFLGILLALCACHRPHDKKEFPSVTKLHWHVVVDEVLEGSSDPNVLYISAYSPSGNLKSWKRPHQLVYNDMVKVIDNKGEASLVEVPNLLIQSHKKASKETLKMWVKSSGLIAAETLKNKKYPFPGKENKYGIVCLKTPFQDPKTGKVFSAGSKFVFDKFLKERVELHAYNKNKAKLHTLVVPKKDCYFYGKRPFRESFRDYINLLRYWSDQPRGFIPYVFGGASWTYTHTKNNFYAKSEGYTRRSPHSIPTGLDCSSMIYTACRVVGLPFFAKNSTTILAMLPPLKEGEHLEEGDIIWMPGHVQVVSRVGVKAQIIEARGYRSGHGKVHAIALAKVFKGHRSLRSLERAYFKENELILLDVKGKESSRFKNWKLLKFRRYFTLRK